MGVSRNKHYSRYLRTELDGCGWDSGERKRREWWRSDLDWRGRRQWMLSGHLWAQVHLTGVVLVIIGSEVHVEACLSPHGDG
jgi:hypothetical protein